MLNSCPIPLKDEDGKVSKESWSRGCQTLNDALPEEERIDAGELFDVLDLDGEDKKLVV